MFGEWLRTFFCLLPVFVSSLHALVYLSTRLYLILLTFLPYSHESWLLNPSRLTTHVAIETSVGSRLVNSSTSTLSRHLAGLPPSPSSSSVLCTLHSPSHLLFPQISRFGAFFAFHSSHHVIPFNHRLKYSGQRVRPRTASSVSGVGTSARIFAHLTVFCPPVVGTGVAIAIAIVFVIDIGRWQVGVAFVIRAVIVGPVALLVVDSTFINTFSWGFCSLFVAVASLAPSVLVDDVVVALMRSRYSSSRQHRCSSASARSRYVLALL
ncbi:hypothetical protein GALMADRAFT_1244310 [Galerina marginata CBS 339.88]|uniref:Uncharacterized protein n=1 Tax=Galerina marginata (strain CBS 339.88) TaxID=685588 RepID=A0A067TB28_GALM3|nr:hypothetical protein GALMADRAFT_1244310 [Galerina marginata CBS 339.88]